MNYEPTHLGLFSGIGGFELAAEAAGFRTIGFCEIDKYCQKVLAKNFLSNSDPNRRWTNRERGSVAEIQENGKNLGVSASESNPRIFGNIFDLDGTQFRGVDLITGGFPCQPFSVAGKRRGAADDRAIWPEMLRVINEARPTWVLGENVPGIIQMELDNVLSDLEGIGYATRAFVIPACAVDAKHRRDRPWIVAHSLSDNNQRTKRGGNGVSGEIPKFGGKKYCSTGEPCRTGKQIRRSTLHGHEIPDPSSEGLEGQRQIACGTGTELNNTGDYCRWIPEPDVGRVAHGIPSRVDRLKALGNAIVPQVAYEILKAIYNELIDSEADSA